LYSSEFTLYSSVFTLYSPVFTLYSPCIHLVFTLYSPVFTLYSLGEFPDLDSPPQAWADATGVPLYSELKASKETDEGTPPSAAAPNSPPHFVLMADPTCFNLEGLLAGLDYAYPNSNKVCYHILTLNSHILTLNSHILSLNSHIPTLNSQSDPEFTQVGGLASSADRSEPRALFCEQRSDWLDAASSDSLPSSVGCVGLVFWGGVTLETIVAQVNSPMKNEKKKKWTLPRIFLATGGSEFEAYPLPSN
jgi:hypothetical protein